MNTILTCGILNLMTYDSGKSIALNVIITQHSNDPTLQCCKILACLYYNSCGMYLSHLPIEDPYVIFNRICHFISNFSGICDVIHT